MDKPVGIPAPADSASVPKLNTCHGAQIVHSGLECFPTLRGHASEFQLSNLCLGYGRCGAVGLSPGNGLGLGRDKVEVVGAVGENKCVIGRVRLVEELYGTVEVSFANVAPLKGIRAM